MKPGKLISRYEYNYYNGWVVSIRRRGRHWVKYFSDKPNGKRAAYQRARDYRDRMLARLPAASKVKRTYIRNTTGEIGVSLIHEVTPSGKPFVRYVASWPAPDGSRKKVSFSQAMYGDYKARQLAVRARRQGLAKLHTVPRRSP